MRSLKVQANKIPNITEKKQKGSISFPKNIKKDYIFLKSYPPLL